MRHNYEAYLMVEFNSKTKLPESIDVFSESEDMITMIGNEYVQICNMKLQICNSSSENVGFECLSLLLLHQFKKGFYDECFFFFENKKWTVKECKEIITLK